MGWFDEQMSLHGAAPRPDAAPVAPNMGLQAPASTSAPAMPLSGYSGAPLQVGQVGVPFNPQSFVGSDAYNFIANEGLEGLGRNKAAQGLLNAPGTLKDYGRFLQGNASTFYGQQLDHDYRMAALNAGISEGNAGRQLSGLSSLSGLGLNAAQGMAGAYGNSGLYNAQGTTGSANAINQGIGAVGNTLADYFAARRNKTATNAGIA